jgi:membrane fusion protein (multidrug efflux system)
MSDEHPHSPGDARKRPRARSRAAERHPEKHHSESHPDAEKKADKSTGKKPGSNGKKPWYRRPALVGPLFLLLLIVVVGGVLLWRHSRTQEKTDDAYVDVVSEQVSPQVSGRVIQVMVGDNQDVQAGQPLVQIDPADYQSRLDQIAAVQAQAEAQLAEAEAQLVVDAAQVEVAQANLGTAEANATNANRQLDRYHNLQAVNAGAVSAQQLDSAVAAATSANAQLVAGQKSVAAAQAQLGYARSQEGAARAGISSAQAQVREADLTLSRSWVKARVNGRVARKTVSPGNYVTPGNPLMVIVPREVYVIADFKETQLNRMRPGQPARIKVDAYADLKLTGKVDSVEPATGQTFSLIPAENATGNWVKIVQRVSVKIVLDQLPDDPGRRLAPGMSAEVWVKVR